MRLLWKWQAKRKIQSDDLYLQYTSIHMLGEYGNASDFDLLINGLNHDSQIIRSVTSGAMKKILIKYQDETEILLRFEETIVTLFRNSTLLVSKLAIIEVIAAFQLSTRENLLSSLVTESENDLQYAVIRSLADTKDRELLDAILKVSDSKDLVLRKTALETWYVGISNYNFDEILTYCTPKLHFLIRATYELQTDGDFLRKVFSYSNPEDLPLAKAYPDTMIRYLIELLGKWEFDPEAYRSLHYIVVPSYFTFDESESVESDRPFVIL